MVTFKLIDELTKVRLATIIDCEGTIAIYKVKEPNKSNNRILCNLRPTISVSQKERWYIEQFKDVFGFGNISNCGKDSKYPQYRAYYIQALIVCIELVDYLQLKRDKAIEIINFYLTKMKGKYYHIDGKLERYGYSAKFISPLAKNIVEMIKNGKK